jgi:hypothetical protein
MTTGAKTPISGPNSTAATPRPAARPVPESAAPTPESVKQAFGWATLATPKYLAALAVVVIVANSAAFYFLRLRSHAHPPAKRSQEMVLGAFEFSRVDPRDKQLKHGQFVVTLHLVENLDAAKFREVHDQEKGLQAAVEEAMRRLRASDLADPRFVRLKNRFQERLNEELGFDGIDEVIVTKVPEPSAEEQDAQEQPADPQAPSGEGTASAEAQPDGSASASPSQNTNAN